jgi:hypothetical protein
MRRRIKNLLRSVKKSGKYPQKVNFRKRKKEKYYPAIRS